MSDELTPQVDFSHQTNVFDPDRFGWPVHVIGAGGIGSALLPLLYKIGVRDLHIHDNDFVEQHNPPNQLLYWASDIGRPKVEVARERLEQYGFAHNMVTAHKHWVTEDTPLEGVVISGVDSMSSRKAIWQAVLNNVFEIPIYMDGRVGGEMLTLLTVDPISIDSAEYYETRLYDDDDVEELDCAARAIIHPVGIVANLILANLTRFYRGMPLDEYMFYHSGLSHFSRFDLDLSD